MRARLVCDMRYTLAFAAYAVYAVKAVCHGPKDGRALRYRLLAHYLLGRGGVVSLGILRLSACPFVGRVHKADIEVEWERWGFSLFGCDDEYNPCFGAFYARESEVPGHLECRDLYDWHPYFPLGGVVLCQTVLDAHPLRVVVEGVASSQRVARPVRAMAARVRNAVTRAFEKVNRVLYSVAGVPYVPGGPVWAVQVPDALWLRLGGRPFISSFLVPMPQDDDEHVWK